MKTIFILFLVLITFSASAQTHNLKKSSCCKFVPGPKNNEGCSPCLACTKEKKVETLARQKEDKVVAQRKAEAYKKQLETKTEADRKQREEDYARKQNDINASQVTIAATPVPRAAFVHPSITIVKPVKGKNVRLTGVTSPGSKSYNNAALTNEGDTVAFLKGAGFINWDNEYQLFSGNYQGDKHPYNYLLISGHKQIRKSWSGWNANYSPCDLMNSEGKLMFNDDSISAIMYIGSNRFLIGYGGGNFIKGIFSLKIFDATLNKLTAVPYVHYTGEYKETKEYVGVRMGYYGKHPVYINTVGDSKLIPDNINSYFSNIRTRLLEKNLVFYIGIMANPHDQEFPNLHFFGMDKDLKIVDLGIIKSTKSIYYW